MTDNRKVIKVHLYNSVVVVLQFQLACLNNWTKLRNKTLSTDGYP